ncbi:MAG: signal peptidase I [Proteobacteria bacterium]|nr:signal peptidase I [Pseudomonadota bacterium]
MIERAPPVPPVSAPQPRRRRFLLFLGIFLSALVALPVGVITAAAFLVNINGWRTIGHEGAMQPSLLATDLIVVESRAYGSDRLPAYGDLVLMNVPGAAWKDRTPGSVSLVKRVIGLPGDRVTVIGGVVSINGSPLKQEELGDYAVNRWGPYRLKRLREQAANGRSYEILQDPAVPTSDSGPYTVPPGRYFVMGDSRDDAAWDSRKWAGAAGWYPSLANIRGRVSFIYWSGWDRLYRVGMVVK